MLRCYVVKYSVCVCGCMRFAASVCRSFTSNKEALRMRGRHSQVGIGGSKSGDLSAAEPASSLVGSVLRPRKMFFQIPIPFMGLVLYIYLHEWLIFMVNVGKI